MVTRHGARFVQEAATRINPAARIVTLGDGETLYYDYLAVCACPPIPDTLSCYLL